MSGHAYLIVVAFATLAVAEAAVVQMRREAPLAEAHVAPLGSLEYGAPNLVNAVVAAQVPASAVPAVRQIADDLGGRVITERAVRRSNGARTKP